jgi:serine/threonine protein kinase
MSEIFVMVNANTPSRNRYLILDVLGQGTFGQVVKCQNLKTQEVVAVKVVKNRTAYFNQSMMEVSVLDLVRIHPRFSCSLLILSSSTQNSIRTTITISCA